MASTKGLLRAEMIRLEVNYKGLVEKQATVGMKETETNPRNKIKRAGSTEYFS